jgi:hypothetical protein
MFLPLDRKWAIDSKHSTADSKSFVIPATVAFKLLVTWLYWDAG